jgi:putative ABC transport system permease protein
MEYIKNRDLGFDREHLVCVPLGRSIRQNIEAAEQDLLRLPGVFSLTTSTLRPTRISWRESGWSWQGKPADEDPLIVMMRADASFLDTFKMEMARGVFFPKIAASGSSDKIIINETFARMMNVEDPIGARASFQGNDFVVTGVIRDFNFMPLYNQIEPLVMFNSSRGSYMYLRIHPQNIPRTLGQIENVHKKFNPGNPFEYSFFDEEFGRIYLSEQRLGSIFRYFAILAVFISCLGIFGLAASTAERRTKEIGIRKVLGAGVPGIVFNLTREFALWVLAANIFAWPAAYFFMNKWLQSFAYRIPVHIGIFVFSAVLALVIALVTVSFHSIKASTSNPIDSLRNE